MPSSCSRSFCSVHGQHDIKNLQGRSVRLDILAVDEANRVYNIEIQRNDKGAGVKRARYNSSLIDTNMTEPGDEYEQLNETYVIFITEHDVLGGGYPIYHIDRTVRETGALFGDESHILYVNAQIKDDTALGQLMHDFSCTRSKRCTIKFWRTEFAISKKIRKELRLCARLWKI